MLWLPDALRDAGVNVKVLAGWDQPHPARDAKGNPIIDVNGNVVPYSWKMGEPEGHMHHHTATGGYTPNRDKANGWAGLGTWDTTRLHQTGGGIPFYVIANAHPAPISSGWGRRDVLDQYVRQDRQFIGKQTLPDDSPRWAGNRYYWNTEYILDGVGSWIDETVWEMMVVVSDVIDEWYGWSPYRNIGHAQHTIRKIDLRDGRHPDMAATILQLQKDISDRRRNMWAEDITDRTWMAMFHSNVPGIKGYGRYYCSNDGTHTWPSNAPWGSNPHAPTRDGDATYADKLNALNYLLAGFAEAAGS